MTFHNLAREYSTTTGTSDCVLSGAVPGFNTWDNAGLITGEIVRYGITTYSLTTNRPTHREAGLGTYTTATKTLARTTVESSTAAGAKITLTGLSEVYITPLKSDFPVGWQPYAYPIAFQSDGTLSINNIAANGGSIATAVSIFAPMLLQSVSVRNGDTTGDRAWGWDLYVDYVNDGLATSNTLTRIANSTADDAFTAAASSTRTIDAASAPVRLSPGVYWIVLQNRHASNTFNFQANLMSTFAPNVCQTKTTTNPNGATLDFVAATWTKVTSLVPSARLNGRVFGEATAF